MERQKWEHITTPVETRAPKTLAQIQEKIENLLSAADAGVMDKNRRDSALERAGVWIEYYRAQAYVESVRQPHSPAHSHTTLKGD